MKRKAPLKRSGKPIARRTRLKTKGRSRFAHRRNKAFAQWVADFRCCIGYYGLDPSHDCPLGYLGSEAAHIKSRGAGGDDARNIVPLCRYHHQEQHTMGIKSFQKKYGIVLQDFADHFWNFYQSGAPRR